MAHKRPTVVAHTLETDKPKSFEESVIDKLMILEARTKSWEMLSELNTKLISQMIVLSESIERLRADVKTRPCIAHEGEIAKLKKRVEVIETKIENWIP